MSSCVGVPIKKRKKTNPSVPLYRKVILAPHVKYRTRQRRHKSSWSSTKRERARIMVERTIAKKQDSPAPLKHAASEKIPWFNDDEKPPTSNAGTVSSPLAPGICMLFKGMKVRIESFAFQLCCRKYQGPGDNQAGKVLQG